MARKPNLLNRKRGTDPLLTRHAYLASLREMRIRHLRRNKKNRAEMDRYQSDLFALLFKSE